MTGNFVRLALANQAASLAAIQRRAWALMPPAIGDPALTSISLDEMTSSWEEAIARPPLAQLRVLVAVEGEQVVGFAVTGPCDDPDADPGADGLVAEFVIDPPARGRGHGSRLLNAVAETLLADGFTAAMWWVPASNDVLRRFLTGSGWAADGAHREIGEIDSGPGFKMVRLKTSI